MRRLWVFAGAVALGLATFEVVMRPSASDRVRLALVFALMGGAAAAAAWWIPKRARRSRSIRRTVALLTLAAPVIVAVGLGAAAGQMFLSPHDLGLTLVVLVFGLAAGVAFAVAVAGPWTEDLARIATVAEQVASGDFSARTTVRRADEVGRLAEAVDRMARSLEEAERKRREDEQARRRFLVAVGHDLRTPLASIRAALEGIADGVVDDPVRMVDVMTRDVAALSRLVDDLFLLARIDSGDLRFEPVDVDLREVADEAMELLSPLAARRSVTLRLEADRAVVVPAGPDAVGRVVRNLVDNAIRHAPPGSEVVVAVADGDDGPSVVVRDSGPGFAAAFVDRAFERFTRSDDARSRDTGGAGLGLAIAKGFVEALGGEVWARPGPGGEVGFRLPGDAGSEASNR